MPKGWGERPREPDAPQPEHSCIGGVLWDIPTMRLTADSKGRLGSRELFPPGRSFEVEKDPNSGRVVLIELVPKEAKPPKVKLVRRKGRTMLVSDRALGPLDVAKALEEFP